MEYIGYITLIIVGIIFCIGGLLLWRFQKTTKRSLKGYLRSLCQVFAFVLFVIGVASVVAGIGLFFQK